MPKRMSYLNIGDQQFKVVDEDSMRAVDAEMASRRSADAAIRNTINAKSIYNPPDFSKIVTIEALVSGANKKFTSQGGWYAADARNLLADGGMCHVQITSSAKVISFSAASSSNEFGNHREMTSWVYFPEGTEFYVTSVFVRDSNLYYAPPLDLPDEEIVAEQDPELLDIRVGYDGTEYDDAGTAVREQISDLHSELSDLADDIAHEFSAEGDYVTGDYVRYNGLLYRFTSDHTGAWDSDDVEEVTLMGQYNEVIAEAEAVAAQFEVDDTLSISGKAADAKATGDAIREVFKPSKVTALSDFNNYMTNGAWLVNSQLDHKPDTTEQGTLLVFAYNTTGNYGYVQIYVTNSSWRMFYRAYVGGAWKDWIEVTRKSVFDDAQEKNFTERAIASTDFNSYTSNGAYLVNDSMTNAPYASANGLLNVFTWNHSNAYGMMQMFIPHNSNISPYYRFKWNSAWSAWQTFAPQVKFEIVEKSATINVLSKDNYSLKGYINTSTGVFVSNNSYTCTKDFIDIPFGVEKIYAKFPQTENNDRICAFLYYDENGNYLSSYSGRFNGYDYKTATIPTVPSATVPSGVAKFKFWANNTSVQDGINDVCLSFSEATQFVEYESAFDVNNNSLETPNIYLPLKGKKIANFGDSIFGNKQAPFSVSYALGEMTGATVYNFGFGGTDMAARSSATWDAFSMYRLAYAIANNDFDLQDTAITDENAGLLAYFSATLTALKAIDWNDIDIITIAFGTNDFTGNISLDNENNPVDTSTFCGALRYSLQQIITAYPHIKIFVCGPTWRFWMNSSNVYQYDSDSYENENNDKLTDFVTAAKNVAEEYHIPFIDNYYDLGINYYNRGHYFPANDGTHHNYLGAKLIAEHIKCCLF